MSKIKRKLTAFKLHSKNVEVLENKQLSNTNSCHLDHKKELFESSLNCFYAILSLFFLNFLKISLYLCYCIQNYIQFPLFECNNCIQTKKSICLAQIDFSAFITQLIRILLLVTFQDISLINSVLSLKNPLLALQNFQAICE